MVASPGHPELNVEKKKMLKKVWSYPVDFCIRFRTIPDNPTLLPHSPIWTPSQSHYPARLHVRVKTCFKTYTNNISDTQYIIPLTGPPKFLYLHHLSRDI